MNNVYYNNLFMLIYDMRFIYILLNQLTSVLIIEHTITIHAMPMAQTVLLNAT